MKDKPEKESINLTGQGAVHSPPAEERLPEYERVVESLDEMIAVVDRDYQYLLANPAFLRFRGLEREQLVGHFVPEIFGDDVFGKVIKPHLDKCFQGEIVRFEMKHTVPNLGERHLCVSYLPLQGQRGVDRVACVLRDITGQIQAEEALRQSRNQLVEAQHITHTGSWHWELQTNDRAWSSELCRIFGLNPDEPAPSLDTALVEIVHPDDRDSFKSAVEASIATGEPCSVVYRIIRPDGAERVIHSRGNVVTDGHGKPIRMFGTAHDITESRQREDALAIRARQQAVVADLGQMALSGAALDLLFNRAVARVAETFGVEYCKVLELLPEGNSLKLVAGAGWKPGLVGKATVGAGRDSQAGFTLLSREPVIVEDLRAETRFHGPALLRDHGVISGLSVVIGKFEKPLGVMGAHTTSRRMFTTDDVNFLLSVANVLAEAIERKRAEEALTRAERKYRDIFENAGEGIFQSTPEGQYIAANPALARMHGFDSPEELIRARNDISNQIYVDPSRRVEFKRLLERDGSVRGFENQIFRKDGSRIWVSVNARMVRDDQGTVIYYEGTAQEITERKQAEEAMSKLVAIVESSDDAIISKTLDGTISSWNQGAERIYGYAAEEVVGAPVSILLPPNRGDELAKIQEKICRGEAVEHYETERVRKDGQIINVSLTVSPIRNADGLVIGASTIARNITARKRSEAEIAALLARELQLRLEAEVMRDANIALTKDLSLENVLQTLLECLSKLVPYDSANVMLLDNDGQFVVSALSGYEDFGDAEFSRAIRLDPNTNPLLRQICATRESVLVGDTRTQPGWQSVPGARHVRNWIGVPLVAYGQVIGLYSLDKADPHVFRADQVRLAETIAAQAASAIQNAQLFHTAQDHSEELEARIAEQKRAEAALRASEQELRLFNLATNDMFWNWDFVTGRVTRSMTFERVFGYSEVEIDPSISWWEDRLHPDDKERVLNEFRTALERGHKSCTYEYRFRRRDGSYATISDRAYIARDQSGNGVRAIGAMTDISERKHAEAALRESEERYRDLIENSRELICTHDLDGLVLSANPAAADAVGYDLDEFVGKKTVRDVLAPEVRDQFDEYMARLSKDGATTGIMYVQTKSGERRVWDYHNSLRTEGVASPIVRGMARDITEERRAQQALRESEERYRELFENAKDALYVHDLSGRYKSFNRAAEELSGFSREEILGKHFSNFVAPGSLKDARTNLCKKLDLEGETTYEIELVRKDRTRVPVEVSSRLIFENGERVGVQGVARDITDRKRAREALRTYSQRLIEAQEAERQVIARELHDEIGQVLTAVRINLQSIKRSAQPGSQLLSIDDSLVIVDGALSRVRELSLNLRPSVLDNLGLSSALRWYVDRYAQRSGIVADLKSNLEEGRRLRVELETACFRIVQEALTNVARHSQATQVWVQLTSSNGTLDLKVKDNGVGFDVDRLLKDTLPARALGLRGMEERAVAARGSFKIDSVPTRGTEVRVSFPLKDGS
jgi:PAS domain S-box-containing protein